MRVAIIGAGNVGGNLGATLAKAGVDVTFGVRDLADAPALQQRAPGTAVALPADAAQAAEVVVLTVPAAAALDAARSLGDLGGKVLVDATNPVAWQDGPVLAPPPEGSIAAALAGALPGVRVVKAFNHFGAELHAEPRIAGGPADALLAGDDIEAKRMVAGLAERAGFRAVDAGPLRNAALLEAQAVLWIHLATKGGHGRRIAFRLVRD
jgi:hypothetical protein